MGLDVYVSKSEVLERNREKGETIIKETEVFHGYGWEFGQFLQDSFGLENCKPEVIYDFEEVCGILKNKLEELNSDNENDEDSYKELVTELLTALEKGSKESGVEYEWLLGW